MRGKAGKHDINIDLGDPWDWGRNFNVYGMICAIRKTQKIIKNWYQTINGEVEQGCNYEEEKRGICWSPSQMQCFCRAY